MVLFDHIHITRMTAVDVSIDVARCFDRMIEACKNLSCRQQGADIQYLKLHGATQQQFRYHVKHAQGISNQFNQHSSTDPWYGAGQGAGDPWLAIQLQFAELKEWKWHGIKMIKQLHQLQTLLMDLLKDHRLSMESGNYPA